MKPFLITFFAVIVFILPASLTATTYYVNPGQKIQDAIDGSTNGDTVIVRAATYTGVGNRDLDFSNGLPAGQTRAITLQSESGADVTIIDCQGTELDPHRAFCFHSGEGSDSVIDGFTIRNGYAGGGGIYCYDNSSPTITNCTISGNTANFGGGGIYCWNNSSPTITNCTISGNEAAHYGGGIYCDSYSDPTISNCTINGNSAVSDGGGIYCITLSNPTITNCTISGNSAGDYGGGIYCYFYSDPTITNCTINYNSARYGGGFYCEFSSPTLTNCTFSRNSADYGGGIGNVEGSPTITNCILWGNAAPTGHEIAVIYYSYPSTLTLRYSDVQGGAGEAYVDPGCTLDLDGTNIDADPLFVSGPLHRYYLSDTAAGQPATSPCVDGGSDTAANLGLDSLTTSNAGYVDTGTVDIGYHAPPHDWLYITWMGRNGNDITICWNASPSTSYVVEWSTNPEFVTYIEVPVGVTYTWTDVGGALQLQRYYRVREQ